MSTIPSEAFLTSEEMLVVAEVFVGSVDHVLKNYDSQAAQSLRGFMAELVMKHKPYLMLTAEGVSAMIEKVWTNDGWRDFLLMLSFTFFSRWGQSSAKVDGLAGNLARGVAQVDTVSPDNAVPRDIAVRLTDIDAARQALAANKWLIVALMIQLFVTVEAPSKSK